MAAVGLRLSSPAVAVCNRPCCSVPRHALGLCRIHYSREYRLRLLRGEFERVEIEPVVRHLDLLRSRGYSWEGIDRAAGIAQDTLLKIRMGELLTIHAIRARRILAIEQTWQRTMVPVPSIGTKRRLAALYWQGWTTKDIGPEIGISWHTIAKAKDSLYARNAAAVDDFYRVYAYTSGPNRTWAKTARRRGAIPAAAWDDDVIDDPDARPQLGESEPSRGGLRRIYLDEVEHLRGFGMSDDEIAERLDVEVHSIRDAERRQRRQRGVA